MNTISFYSLTPQDMAYIRRNIPCQGACPVLTNIPAYINAIYNGEFDDSYRINKLANLFPGVLGRICSRPCEEKCRHGEPDLGEPVNICHLKRAAADLSTAKHVLKKASTSALAKTICIVGAGPAGLAAAYDLALSGMNVTIFEANEEPGGMLRYGIPEFRLPRSVLRKEIDQILALGIHVETGVKVGQHISLEELRSKFDSVVIATGCYKASKLNIPGEDMAGVYPGLNFMMDVCSGRPPQVGDKVIVIGAGFTAFDCARTALRLGAKEVMICLRRTEADLTVTKEEILETKKEGIIIQGLMVAQAIEQGDGLKYVKFLRTRPTTLRPDGKREVEPIEGSDFTISANTIIVATGQSPDPLTIRANKGRSQSLSLPTQDSATPLPGLYLAGDFLTGPSTVIEAIASGRKVASTVLADLGVDSTWNPTVKMQETDVTYRERAWDFLPRQNMPMIESIDIRLSSLNKEVETGFNQEIARTESKRCYLCYLHYEIDLYRCIYCRLCIDVAPRDCIKMVKAGHVSEEGTLELSEASKWNEVAGIVIDNERCIRCGECMRVCPVKCISVSRIELVPSYEIREGGDGQ